MKVMLSSTVKDLKKRVVYQDGLAKLTEERCSCNDVKFNEQFLKGNVDHGSLKFIEHRSVETKHFQDHMIKFIQDLYVDSHMFEDSEHMELDQLK